MKPTSRYQPYIDFPAHAKNIAAVSKMLWLLDSSISDVYPYTAIVVFEAFTVESYLNTLGWKNIEFWEELERLPWKKKIAILHKHMGKKEDWGRDPLQFAQEIFQIRDKLAHGKPEKILGDVFDCEEEANRTLGTNEMEPDWYKKIDRNWVLRSKSRFHLLMVYLSELMEYSGNAYKIAGKGGVIEIEDS